MKFLPLLSLGIYKKTHLVNSHYSNQQIQTSIQRLYLSPLDFSLSQFKVFQLDTGQLGKQVAAHLDVQLGGLVSQKFNDGQCNIQILNSVRGHNVYLIKCFSNKTINDGIMQLLIAVSTLKKQGAGDVTCIIPFFPYSQSVDFHVQQPKTFFTCFGSDILKLLEEAGCKRVVTFNSLMSYPKGFVNQSTFVNINAPDLFLGHLTTKHLKDPILVSAYVNTPNMNNLKILQDALKTMNLDCPISTFNQGQYIGQKVQGRDVILYSNVIRTGNTFTTQSKKLKEYGARNIYGCAFHSLTSVQEMRNVLRQSRLKEILTTNSVPHMDYSQRVKRISLSRLIAETISLFQEEKPLNQYRVQIQNKKIEASKKIKSSNKQDQKLRID